MDELDDLNRIQIYLYTKEKLPVFRTNKLLADFAASQFSPGGYLSNYERKQEAVLDLDGFLSGYLPKSSFGSDDDLTSWLRKFYYYMPSYKEALKASDPRKISKPELRILLRAFTALFLQKEMPRELEADFSQTLDPNLFSKVASVVWLFSRDDEWPRWQKVLRSRAETLKAPPLEFL